ncbi:MAG: polysaccharide deacetylase family protein [Planctomycetota bacterium]|nr:polysaccharide deacetylase family protein [Planctomycetota bacterium]
MGLFRDPRIVPALMFHTVGLERHPWVWSEISESVESFEEKISLLAAKKFCAISWSDLHAYMGGKKDVPPDSILLTFDDGYLDNWVFIYPLLKKYGMQATIFVNPDFVQPETSARPNLEDVWNGRCRREDLTIAGFLNWAELESMQRSGVIDIQSHAKTHTWYFSGSEIVDFYAPRSIEPYPWLLWNARPDRKPFYLSENQQGFVPWGTPVFEHEKSLIVRRFFPDEPSVRRITDHVAEQGGAQFFDKPDWTTRLQQFASATIEGRPFPGRYETDAEYEARVRDELAGSKELLEAKLGKPVDFICWPGGGNNQTVRRIAKEIGYKAWTLSSRDEGEKRNVAGTDPCTIKRIGTSNSIHVKGRRCGVCGARFQLLRIRAHQQSWIHTMLLKGYKFAALSGTALS